MKKLKLTELDKQDKLNVEELKCLKGGFVWGKCSCCCCCGKSSGRGCNRRDERSGNCRCNN